MSRKTPLITELTLGVILTGLVAWAYGTRYPLIEALNLKTFDLFSKFRPSSADTAAIQIVEIDENSVKQLGRWPWPRPLQAQLIDEIASSGAKVIGLNIGYWDADQSEQSEKLSDITEAYVKLLNDQKVLLKRKGIKLEPFTGFLDYINKLKEDLNGDKILARTIEEAATVVLPMFFQPGTPVENLDPMPETFPREKAVNGSDPSFPRLGPSMAAALPLETFSKAALRIGHCNLSPDVDGTIRRIFPLMRYGDFFYPSFAIQIIREYRNALKDPLVFKKGVGFTFGRIQLPIDEEGGMYIQFAGPSGSFKRYSALDVLTNGIPQGSFDKKIVLLGVTVTGGSENFIVPGGDRMNGLEIWANHLENILTQRFILRPEWGQLMEWNLLLLTGLVVILILPFLRARFSIPLAGIVFVGMMSISFFLFVKKGLWFSPTYGAFLLLTGFLMIIAKRLLFTERSQEFMEQQSVETNKLLGLSFQGQGMLDLAFEKFRKCPVDTSMKELLYNLGLDLERKRQFSKAAAVYEHIAANDPKYKDIKNKIELLKKAGEGILLGPLGKKGTESTVVLDGLGQNTTLGRYEVVKELGRGAMGIVYLGRDPKINRQMAIKTLRFEDEADEETVKSTKERFFREAESAGNLTHPNIIRIFDAGEDQDVAYIAMELLEGQDLKKFCEKENLLPIETVVEYGAIIADALEYAHQQGVVHRDIKPGNIMLLKDQTLRITDFGIARIQATSKTATGAVLGTPAYMSPEQVMGKKVDGRADIFSLGVTLYELLTGEKPFQAESIAALLYRIANVEAPDPREYNSKVPESLVPILKKALAKSADDRYQTGGELAKDLRNFLVHSHGITVPENPTAVKNETAEPAPESHEYNPPNFYSELQQAFHLSNQKPVNEGPVEKPTSLPLEKPVVQEGVSKEGSTILRQEKTANISPVDAPLMDGIEHNFHPPEPKPESAEPAT